MELELRINSVVESIEVSPQQTLLSLLRQKGYTSVKQGCETGDCGVCMVAVDGVPRPACVLLAAQVGGCTVTTVEGIGTPHHLHPIQEAFRDVGAVQCGFCTPGMIVSAYTLLRRNPRPSEDEVREALSSNLCRCTGYVKPVQAVLRAAALLRGEQVTGEMPRVYAPNPPNRSNGSTDTLRSVTPITATTGTMPSIPVRRGPRPIVGTSLPNIEAVKLATGQPTFTDDVHPQGMLYAALLTSPHAHAVIRSIDVSDATALSGVHAVLTYKDVPRVPYASGDSTGPQDRYSLDYIVRHVGDRVAAVAAETPELAQQAIEQIHVEYDILPVLLDPRQSLEANAPRIHSESESRGIADARRNLAGRIRIDEGSIERGFAESDVVVESEYSVPVTHVVANEKHSTLTYFDENNCLVVRTATQVPHMVRRTLSTLLDLPTSHIRIVRPNVGGSFGTKQGIVLEDICALLTLATHRPVSLTYSRTDEFRAGRVQQRHIVRMKTGTKRDGTLLAQQMLVLASTGAYATHPLLRANQTSPLTLYSCSHQRFSADVFYTNTPSSITSHEIAPELFALECHMDEVAQRLGIDALTLRRKNWSNSNSHNHSMQGEQVYQASSHSDGLATCVQVIESRVRESGKDVHDRTGGHMRRGTGIALTRYSSDVNEVSGATIMLNEGGTFDVFVAIADDTFKTMLAQIAAETLGVPVDAVVLHTMDTSNIPFSAVADASSLLASTGNAVKEAASHVRQDLLALVRNSGLMTTKIENLSIEDGVIIAREQDEQQLVLQLAAEQIIIVQGKHVIASATHKGTQSASYAVHKADVEVDTTTGAVHVVRLVVAVDGGRIINPLLAEGQVQGAVSRAMNATMSEELLYDKQGHPLMLDLSGYRLYRAPDMPDMQVTLVESGDAQGPSGAKSVSEVAALGVAPAITNAVANALGVRIRQLPLTPERILRTMYAQESANKR